MPHGLTPSGRRRVTAPERGYKKRGLCLSAGLLDAGTPSSGAPRVRTHKNGFCDRGFVIHGLRRETADDSRLFLADRCPVCTERVIG